MQYTTLTGWRQNHMIISIEVEKALHRAQDPFMIENTQQTEREWIFLNTRKTIYEKPTTNIILHGERLKVFPLKINKMKNLPAFAKVSIVLEVPVPVKRQWVKRNQMHPKW